MSQPVDNIDPAPDSSQFPLPDGTDRQLYNTFLHPDEAEMYAIFNGYFDYLIKWQPDPEPVPRRKGETVSRTRVSTKAKARRRQHEDFQKHFRELELDSTLEMDGIMAKSQIKDLNRWAEEARKSRKRPATEDPVPVPPVASSSNAPKGRTGGNRSSEGSNKKRRVAKEQTHERNEVQVIQENIPTASGPNMAGKFVPTAFDGVEIMEPVSQQPSGSATASRRMAPLPQRAQQSMATGSTQTYGSSPETMLHLQAARLIQGSRSRAGTPQSQMSPQMQANLYTTPTSIPQTHSQMYPSMLGELFGPLGPTPTSRSGTPQGPSQGWLHPQMIPQGLVVPFQSSNHYTSIPQAQYQIYPQIMSQGAMSLSQASTSRVGTPLAHGLVYPQIALPSRLVTSSYAATAGRAGTPHSQIELHPQMVSQVLSQASTSRAGTPLAQGLVYSQMLHSGLAIPAHTSTSRSGTPLAWGQPSPPTTSQGLAVPSWQASTSRAGTPAAPLADAQPAPSPRLPSSATKVRKDGPSTPQDSVAPRIAKARKPAPPKRQSKSRPSVSVGQPPAVQQSTETSEVYMSPALTPPGAAATTQGRGPAPAQTAPQNEAVSAEAVESIMSVLRGQWGDTASQPTSQADVPPAQAAAGVNHEYGYWPSAELPEFVPMTPPSREAYVDEDAFSGLFTPPDESAELPELPEDLY